MLVVAEVAEIVLVDQVEQVVEELELEAELNLKLKEVVELLIQEEVLVEVVLIQLRQ